MIGEIENRGGRLLPDTPRYAPVRRGDYIRQRFDKAFAYRKATAG